MNFEDPENKYLADLEKELASVFSTPTQRPPQTVESSQATESSQAAASSRTAAQQPPAESPRSAAAPLPDEPLSGGREAGRGEDDDAFVASLSEAYGIVTTGIDPLEITELGAQITGYISVDKRDSVRLGGYVTVPYDAHGAAVKEDLFARIGKIRYCQEFVSDDATEIHSRRMLEGRGLERISENDYKLLARLEPICILYKKGNMRMRRMTDRIPRPNAPILPVTDKDMVRTGLNLPQNGIFLGHLSVGGEVVRTRAVPPTVAYYLRNDYEQGDPLIFRHMLVCGSTGTGKTFLTKNILRQFMGDDCRYRLRADHSVRKRPCLVVMDPQDEYSQLLEDNPEIDESDRMSFESENVAFGGVGNTRTFLAKVAGQRYGGRSLAEQIEFTIPFSFVEGNPWILEMSELTDNQKIGLETLLTDYFKMERAKGIEPTYIGFRDFVNDPANKAHYTEETDKIHESSYGGISRKVLNKLYEKIFDQDAPSIMSILKTVFKDGQVSVFPTEYISSSRIRDMIVLVIMTILVDNKLSTSGDEAIKNTPVILALDEAHRYLSKAEGLQSEKIISKFAEAAKQGRKEGLGLFLITQDPQDIETEILKQVNTKIVLNLNNDAAISAVKIPSAYEKRVPYLKKGQMIVHSPDNSDVVEIMGLGTCTVMHK